MVGLFAVLSPPIIECVPKRPRQAHVQRQITRKRKSGRRDGNTATAPESSLDLSTPVTIPGVAFDGPVAPLPMPSSARRARPQASAANPRPAQSRAGQLPTFERAYLVEEMRRIGITSGVLLAFIIVLTILLR
jgi:hypothetical protein